MVWGHEIKRCVVNTVCINMYNFMALILTFPDLSVFDFSIILALF